MKYQEFITYAVYSNAADTPNEPLILQMYDKSKHEEIMKNMWKDSLKRRYYGNGPFKYVIFASRSYEKINFTGEDYREVLMLTKIREGVYNG